MMKKKKIKKHYPIILKDGIQSLPNILNVLNIINGMKKFHILIFQILVNIKIL